MEFEVYKEEAVKTAIYGAGDAIFYPTLGLINEAGEVAGKVKKVIRDSGGIFSPKDVQDIGKEIGDVLWYMAALCRDLGLDFNEVANNNLIKLKDRQERGVIQGSGDNR